MHISGGFSCVKSGCRRQWGGGGSRRHNRHGRIFTVGTKSWRNKWWLDLRWCILSGFIVSEVLLGVKKRTYCKEEKEWNSGTNVSGIITTKATSESGYRKCKRLSKYQSYFAWFSDGPLDVKCMFLFGKKTYGFSGSRMDSALSFPCHEKAWSDPYGMNILLLRSF